MTQKELSALTAEIRAQFRGLARSQAALEAAKPSCEGSPPADDAAREDDPEPVPDAAQLQEYDRTRSLIQVASHSGAWSAEDREAFRASIETLPASMRNELISELLRAINSDRLKPDYAGPPF